MTDPLRRELLPCPFCGSAPVLTPDDSYGACLIGCGVCAAAPSVQYKVDEIDLAVSAWNTRAPSPELAAARKAGFVAGYNAGFMASGEGFNGEYPHALLEECEADKYWLDKRAAAIRALED